MSTGDRVKITFRGRTVLGKVTLASGNGRSLMLEFEAILGGFVGMLPVVRLDGQYIDVFFGEPVEIVELQN
jgi:hypothetical protein